MTASSLARIFKICLLVFGPIFLSNTSCAHRNDAIGYSEDTVSFQSSTFRLVGTLTVPDGNGPFPVAVLIHGSGPEDRDETISYKGANAECLFPGLVGKESKPFKDITHALAAHGIASLRFDKRVFTYKIAVSMRIADLSPYDEMGDVIAAVDYVRSLPAFRNSPIILIGHSQGVHFLPYVVKARPFIAGAVSMAGLARPMDTTFAEQIRNIFFHCGDSSKGELQSNYILQALYKVRQGGGTPLMGAYPKYWREAINMADSAVRNFQSLHIPLLFLQGDSDLNVSVENFRIYQSKLGPNAKMVLFPGLNHQFCTMQDPSVSNDALNVLVNWILTLEKKVH
ncbi:MAG TPA: alpha/beta hydrolase [Candidatus Kapabacteria bacterium]|jgi:hypothetical protein|nr:alpha/beta hydrolase [Candidatus Kapabacteria bacterium]